jgi:HSP20 family protein
LTGVKGIDAARAIMVLRRGGMPGQSGDRKPRRNGESTVTNDCRRFLRMHTRSAIMATNLRTYEPLTDLFRTPFFDMTGYFDTPRMRRAFASMPEAPEIKMNVSEDPEAYYVKAEIPGVKKEDIQVTCEGNTVSISAQVEEKKEKREGETVLCSEMYEGRVARTFTLLSDVDDSKAEAKYEDGVLELKLPKKVGSRSKALSIK